MTNEVDARGRSDQIAVLEAARPVLDAMAQPVVVNNLDTEIIYWNAAATALYGYSAEEALGHRIRTLLQVTADHLEIESADAEMSQQRSWNGELQVRTRSGASRTVVLTLTPLNDADGEVVAFIGSSVDVTVAAQDRRRLSDALALVEEQSHELRRRALHDVLTDLPNRALILDRAEQMLSRVRRDGVTVAAMFVDLDHFKDINDGLGHAAGDELLRAVAARMASTLRDTDTVGRLGGDEFIVLAEGAARDGGAVVIAERLLNVLREPFVLHSSQGRPTTYRVTASVGIAEGIRPCAEDLLHDADLALYEAKAAGRNCYALFDPGMSNTVQQRLSLEADLRSALLADQFFLEYQPNFNLYDTTTAGVEVLLRWQHPARGVVAPLTFISTLENSGMILPVGRWILEQACHQCATWHHSGLPLTVWVNVSARQLKNASFCDDVLGALARSGLPPAGLGIEIAESILMQNAEETVQRLETLKLAGVRIAIDNFGTGYSSLAALRRFPVDVLKIDQTFIAASNDSQGGEALLNTLVQLGKRLGLQTVAKGIETVGELHRLQLLDCDTGQGFLIAKPMTADAIPQFVHAARARAANPDQDMHQDMHQDPGQCPDSIPGTADLTAFSV